MSSDQQLGDVVSSQAPCTFPKHEGVAGRLVKLLPLRANHAGELFKVMGGSRNNQLYDYMPYGPFDNADAYRDHIRELSNSEDPQFYTIAQENTGIFMGHLSLLRVDVKNRTIEIGHILLSSEIQRTTAATEAWYLLANKAFENGFRRLEWKCNAHNDASRRAARRFGHTFEGVFRQHMIVKGRNRDSAWFSILDTEWPTRKRAFENWLHPSNFDATGKQKKGLLSFQEEEQRRK